MFKVLATMLSGAMALLAVLFVFAMLLAAAGLGYKYGWWTLIVSIPFVCWVAGDCLRDLKRAMEFT
jgi:hypothetical protein